MSVDIGHICYLRIKMPNIINLVCSCLQMQPIVILFYWFSFVLRIIHWDYSSICWALICSSSCLTICVWLVSYCSTISKVRKCFENVSSSLYSVEKKLKNDFCPLISTMYATFRSTGFLLSNICEVQYNYNCIVKVLICCLNLISRWIICSTCFLLFYF